MVSRLDCTVRDYAWGHPTFIPNLIGRAPTGAPQAELWMGAHPGAPSRLAGSSTDLDSAIKDDPATILGQEVAGAFGQLPMLFKVLAADLPLSIQAHPSLEQAQAGFARENASGIPLDGPERTYRDSNHKPELICALLPSDAKCGFRSADETLGVLTDLDRPELEPLLALLAVEATQPERIRSAMAYLLRLAPPEASGLAKAVAEAAAASISDGDDSSPDNAELRWTGWMANEFGYDIGLVVALFLNHVHLEPGEALFLPAGNLHAYLDIAGVEVMANSDNVIRGGLTPKHIDVEELLDVLEFSPIAPPVQRPRGSVHTYDAPVPEFSLTRVDLSAGGRAEVSGPAIVLLTEGHIDVPALGRVEKGQPLFISAADGPLAVRGDSGLAWVASVTSGQVVGSARL